MANRVNWEIGLSHITARPGRNVASLADRFWKFTDIRSDNECWPWTGPKDLQGYGFLISRRADKTKTFPKAHRLSWEMAFGQQIPPRLYVLHNCDNPSCVNPRHLRIGTQKDNIADCIAKGRHARAKPKETLQCTI